MSFLRARRSLATYAQAPLKNYPSITPPYAHLLQQLALARQILNRPLTLAEKIIYSHLDNVEEGLLDGKDVRGQNFLKLRPDRVAMQGAYTPCAVETDATRCVRANGAAAVLDVRQANDGRPDLDSLRPSHQCLLWRRGRPQGTSGCSWT